MLTTIYTTFVLCAIMYIVLKLIKTLNIEPYSKVRNIFAITSSVISVLCILLLLFLIPVVVINFVVLACLGIVVLAICILFKVATSVYD